MAVVQATFLGSMLLVTPLGVAPALAANPSANLDQCANGPAPSSPTDGCNPDEWVNGNLGASKSIYREGDSIPYRMRFDNLDTSIDHTVIIEWDTTKGSKHALDYVTTWNRTVADSDPCVGVSGCSASTTYPIPVDPQVSGAGVTPVAGNFTFFGATITAVSSYSYPTGSGFTGDKSARIAITFTADVANPVLAWGGHIASRQDWGMANSAVAISGSPYHMRLIDLDGAGGNQDRSLSAAAVIFPASITIIKQANPEGDTEFDFTAGTSPLSNFTLVDDGTAANTKVFSGITDFKTYTVTETVPSGWNLTGRACQVTSPNGGSRTNSGLSGISIVLKEGENVTCTFTNSIIAAPQLSIDKVDDTGTFDSVGDVINYTITVTNTGNVPLTNVVVTDPNVTDLDCTPNTPLASLAVGGSITCSASHTITQADIDAGSFYNQACTDDGNGDGDTGAAAVCDDVTTDGSQTPSLSITKVDNTGTFDSVGDVISYTITATNDGNVTLHDVVVTDAQVSNLVCVPSTPVADLAPGASISCTASHTITQADIDLGSFYNQACTDDGNGDGDTGAAAICDDVTTNGDQNPSLSITKVDNTGTFDSVGDVISYTITATNDGNVTLHDVVVTDAQVSNLVCDPVTPVADLAPGASISCTASHTITQADIDAGSFYNQACTDDGNGDGATGAAAICDDVSTDGDQNPALSITKVDNVDSFDSVGDVISYTITATNTGNVTLHDVVVTDPNVSDLVCVPSTPVADLAPNATIDCTASHTATQADLDLGSFYNQACVDDGEGGAAGTCADVTTPGDQNPSLAIEKLATESGFDSVGDVINYTITATNDGNVTLHDVVVTDAQVSNLVCDPVTPVADLAPGDSITCTASHTIDQGDIDNGSFWNQACTDDEAGAAETGANPICDDVTTPGSKNPHLSIDKVDNTGSFDSVGDVIGYTITATNDGNVTLHDVVVTDSQVSNLVCDPVTPVADLAPGDSITCTASHTITQEDLDAGSFYNQACVDDGQGGAASECDDVTTPGTKNPHLAILKIATESGYDSVGDVIHYTITATNDGNVTLHAVVVTDANVSNLDCTPATPVADLAPGESITCTASHTVTQGDLDEGSFLNQACVDDGEGGAAGVCDDVDTPSNPNPLLGITKVAAESGYDAVGDVIHYTIVATNTGNVTLHDVVVTDPNVTDLSCTPTLPVADLAPGASITCTATHTVVLADFDTALFNEACVDDGEGGAAEVCDDVTTFGEQPAGETILPTLPNTAESGPQGRSAPSDGAWLLLLMLGMVLGGIVLVTPRRGVNRS